MVLLLVATVLLMHEPLVEVPVLVEAVSQVPPVVVPVMSVMKVVASFVGVVREFDMVCVVVVTLL